MSQLSEKIESAEQEYDRLVVEREQMDAKVKAAIGHLYALLDEWQKAAARRMTEKDGKKE